MLKYLPFAAFVKRREPDYSGYFIPIDQGRIPVVYDELDGLPDPVRPSLFATANEHPPARFQMSYMLGPPAWQADNYGGKLVSPEPLAWTPDGELSVEAQRRVVERPNARGQGRV